MKYIYNFPVADRYDAKDVTEAHFDLDNYKDNIYVNLDEFRGKDLFIQIKDDLKIDHNSNKLIQKSDSFIKRLFTGHRGTGKTTELKRLHSEINNPDAYLSIFIELEKETIISKFAPQDLYVLLIFKLVETIRVNKIDYNPEILNELARRWFSSEEIIRELNDVYDIQLCGEVGAGIDLWSFLKIKSSFRSIFSSQSKTSKKIREDIKNNPLEIISKFNKSLNELRILIEKSKLGKDILFIIDGSEKITDRSVYKKLFIEDAHLMSVVNAIMILSIPIDVRYEIENSTDNFGCPYIVPMIKIDGNSNFALKEIISKRIVIENFFDEGVVEKCVEYSGGCVRQLFQIVNKCLSYSYKGKVSLNEFEKSITELGQYKYDCLDDEHLQILQKGIINVFGNAKVRELLSALVVLKYNGIVEVNPLIKPFLNGNK